MATEGEGVPDGRMYSIPVRIFTGEQYAKAVKWKFTRIF